MIFRKKHDSFLQNFVRQTKEETSLLTQWLHYFYKKNDEHDIRIRLLEQHAHRTNKTDEHKMHKMASLEYQTALLNGQLGQLQHRINIILEAQEPLLKKIEDVEGKMANTGQMHTPLYESLKELHHRLSLLEKGEKENTDKKSITVTPKDKLAKKIARKSKEYVKHTIQSLIEKYGKIEGLQLREIVVDEQRLCSKSTFYRLLSELESGDTIGSVRQAKEKIYVSQLEKPVLR